MSDQQQEQTREVAEAPPKKTIADVLEDMRPKLEAALQDSMPIDYFVRVALTATQKDNRLLQADPRSFFFAIMDAAQLRLALDGHLGHAYLVAFWSKRQQSYQVQLMTGYKGLMYMARRSGEISKIEPRVVYEGDRFDYAYGLEQRLVHIPAPIADRGEWTHVYAIAHYCSAGTPPQFEVMPKDDVIAIRDRSPGGRSDKKTPWDTDEVPMSLKTVIRKLCKWLPMGLEDQRQLEKEEQFDARVPDYEIKRPAAIDIGDLASTEAPPTPEERAEVEEPAEEDAEGENPQVRAIRKIYERGVASKLWNAGSFYKEWVTGKFGMMPRSKTLDAIWDEMPEHFNEEELGGALTQMQAALGEHAGEFANYAKTEDPGDMFEGQSDAE